MGHQTQALNAHCTHTHPNERPSRVSVPRLVDLELACLLAPPQLFRQGAQQLDVHRHDLQLRALAEVLGEHPCAKRGDASSFKRKRLRAASNAWGGTAARNEAGSSGAVAHLPLISHPQPLVPAPRAPTAPDSLLFWMRNSYNSRQSPRVAGNSPLSWLPLSRTSSRGQRPSSSGSRPVKRLFWHRTCEAGGA